MAAYSLSICSIRFHRLRADLRRVALAHDSCLSLVSLILLGRLLNEVAWVFWEESDAGRVRAKLDCVHLDASRLLKLACPFGSGLAPDYMRPMAAQVATRASSCDVLREL